MTAPRATSSSICASTDSAADPIAELLGAPLDDSRLPEQRRERMLQALVALVEALANKEPLLLVFEDIHDADMSTLELTKRVCSAVKSSGSAPGGNSTSTTGPITCTILPFSLAMTLS